jgi:hypothetical protein
MVRLSRRRFGLAAAVLLSAIAWPESPAANGKAEAIDALLRGYHEVGAFNGSALVAANGQVVLKKGYGLADFEWKIPNTEGVCKGAGARSVEPQLRGKTSGAGQTIGRAPLTAASAAGRRAARGSR